MATNCGSSTFIYQGFSNCNIMLQILFPIRIYSFFCTNASLSQYCETVPVTHKNNVDWRARGFLVKVKEKNCSHSLERNITKTQGKSLSYIKELIKYLFIVSIKIMHEDISLLLFLRTAVHTSLRRNC
jgi:hypothetical protein